ncbi:MAG: tyrosine-type recombinase/integrase, partial [Candidatus Aminicenantes bacterium]|nr:tyrosine-type recombinase/integrase [Candidatus Aminicenantes bacterium]
RTGDRIKDVKKGFKGACDRAKIIDCRFHDLRHTAITLMLEAGAPLPTVMEIVGHRDIRTTMRYYHLTPEKSRRAVEILAEIVSQNQPNLGSQWANANRTDSVSRYISNN